MSFIRIQGLQSNDLQCLQKHPLSKKPAIVINAGLLLKDYNQAKKQNSLGKQVLPKGYLAESSAFKPLVGGDR